MKILVTPTSFSRERAPAAWNRLSTFASAIVNDLWFSILFDDEFAISFCLYGAVIVSCVRSEDKKGCEWFRTNVDASMGIPFWHIEHLAGCQFLQVPFSFRVFHQHEAVSPDAPVNFRCCQNGVEVSLRHEIFVPDLAGIGNACAECEVTGIRRRSELKKFIDKRISIRHGFIEG